MSKNVLSAEQLQSWIKNGYNVLLKGKHGIGKTERIREAFTKAGFKEDEVKYFSCATLDPWADFIGIPKERVGEDGVPYLDFVRPKVFAANKIRAIFLDEYNRASSPKIINATMELIQFKSINGVKFPNLEVVWAAINPGGTDSTYSVNDLDPAHLDRFHIQVDLPYEPDAEYFTSKYGKEIAAPALSWWRGLDDTAKNEVSPRRLDYILNAYANKVSLMYFADKRIDLTRLERELAQGSNLKRLLDWHDVGDKTTIREKLSDDDFYVSVEKDIMSDDILRMKFLEYFPEERLTSAMRNQPNVNKYVFDNPVKFHATIEAIANSPAKGAMVTQAKKVLADYAETLAAKK